MIGSDKLGTGLPTTCRNRAFFVGAEKHLANAYPPELRKEFGQLLESTGPDFSPGERWSQRTAELAQAEILLGTWGMPRLDRTFLEAAPNLRAVFYAAGSVRNLVSDELFDRGIIISSAWRANAIPVSEFTLGAILLSLKRTWEHAREGAKGPDRRRLRVPGAYHSRVGLVSLGAIGRRMVDLLSPFDLDVVAFDPYFPPAQSESLGIELAPIDEVFSTCPVVSLHTPWLPETEGMIGRELISSMPEGATLINTARGAVINEPELCEVLRERPDLTAILDVTYPEPPESGSPLLTLPNVVLTPHIAGSMDGEVARMGWWMLEECQRFLRGEELRHSINRHELARMA